MDELFYNRLNLKGLVFLVSDLGWMEVSHGFFDSNLPFPPWIKFFYGHLLARTLDFGMIDVPVPMNWDGGSVQRVVEGIHNDKDVWPMWVLSIRSRVLLFSFLNL